MSKRVRQSNMELLRIVAMLLVLAVHVNFFSIGKPSQHEIANNPISSFVRIEFEALSIVCVNLFVLISGYFGIKLKLKSICNFLFQLFFVWILIYILVIVTGYNTFTFWSLLTIIIPGWQNGWFIASYLMLLLFSPLLNYFANNSNRKEFKLFLFFFFLIQTTLGWIYPFWNMFNNGYTVISFIGLYLLARYIYIYI